MVNAEEQQSMRDRKIGDAEDCIDQSLRVGECSDESSTAVDDASSSSLRDSSVSSASERLTEDGDGGLLLQGDDREDNLLQWLRALDVQVMGACRADERLKPLFKLNISTGAAEDRLLAQLSQQFEPSEVGLLARCLCVPLVSVRVGKINKQGTLFCPTTIRGNLNLTLLPTSELRILFVGDDGFSERLATLSNDTQCSAVEIEEIAADKSGRSFSLKMSDYKILYFWCSEKSKFLGLELLRKMRDLLKRKPSLAELTGISESRLESFANHLRAYLVGTTITGTHSSNVLTQSLNASVASSEIGLNDQSSVGSLRPSRYRHNGSQGVKTGSLYQGSLSPRPSSFKEGVPKNLYSLKTVTRDKFRRCGDSYISSIDNVPVTSTSSSDASGSCLDDKFHETSGTLRFSPSCFPEPLGKSAIELPVLNPATQVPSIASPLLSPYYCWCPPVASTLQYTSGSSPLATLPSELPSLPVSFLSVNRSSSLLTAKPPLNLADLPSLDFPPLLPEPLVRFPLSLPTSQQIPTFTPLICDPIVHIPVIDVCSSGQGYLVSAGPTISTAIPPLCSNIVSPLIPEAESMVENSARETLRFLISSSNQPNPPLMNVLPSFLMNSDEKQSILAAGSRGLYSGTRDIDATANSRAAMALVPPSGRFDGCSSVLKKGASGDNLVGDIPKSSEWTHGSSSGCSFPNAGETD